MIIFNIDVKNIKAVIGNAKSFFGKFLEKPDRV